MKNRISNSVWFIALLMAVCIFAVQPQTGQSQGKVGIARMWEGRTSVAKADAYERYLQENAVPQMRSAAGNLGIQILRRNNPTAVEFIVISYWESRDAIKKIVGEDIERAYSLPRDPEFLLEPVTTVRHYLVTYTNTAKLGSM
jgi:heme-degrading monooxygenase HmoA